MQIYDRKIMCNGALMVCLNSLVLANHKQSFIANMLVDSTPLYSLMLICVNNQSIEWPPKTSNREKLVTLITITEATWGLSNPIRQGTLTWALRICPNQLGWKIVNDPFSVPRVFFHIWKAVQSLQCITFSVWRKGQNTVYLESVFTRAIINATNLARDWLIEEPDLS